MEQARLDPRRPRRARDPAQHGRRNFPGTIEAERTIGLGLVDRQLTQLIRSGALDGLRGIVLGRFPGFEDYADRGWNLIDVLRDRLSPLGVPVLGGLELGHGPDPHAVPLGTMAELDTDSGTLTLRPPAR